MRINIKQVLTFFFFNVVLSLLPVWLSLLIVLLSNNIYDFKNIIGSSLILFTFITVTVSFFSYVFSRDRGGFFTTFIASILFFLLLVLSLLLYIEIIFNSFDLNVKTVFTTSKVISGTAVFYGIFFSRLYVHRII